MYYSKSKTGYILRLEIGEEIQETLKQFAESQKIKGAFYQGIGALTRVELAFFSVHTKRYDRKFFEGHYELVSCIGNISASDGNLVAHSHVSLGDRNFQTISGHLVRGFVSVTAEIFLTPVDNVLSRIEDPILNYQGLVSSCRIHLPVQT